MKHKKGIGIIAATALIMMTGCSSTTNENIKEDIPIQESTTDSNPSYPLSAQFMIADSDIIRTYEVTDGDLSKELLDNDELVTMVRYYELTDGTWRTDDHSYKYRLEITGRMGGAAKDSTFVFLSNIEDIFFDQAWKAAGLSSDLNDYFNEDDAVLVAMK